MSVEATAGRHERAARNQSLFREVNERIEEVMNTLTEFQTFVCECAKTDCAGQLGLTLDEYEQIRAHPARFAVAPGHVVPEVERVVKEAAGRYDVVEKIAKAAEVATELDPRERQSA